MTGAQGPGGGLEASVSAAMGGADVDVVGALLAAEVVVPSGSPVGERFEGFVPVLYDRDGVPVLAVFASLERARGVADMAPYAVTMTGSDLVARMPPHHGLVLNPGYSVGFELPPEGVDRVKARLGQG